MRRRPSRHFLHNAWWNITDPKIQGRIYFCYSPTLGWNTWFSTVDALLKLGEDRPSIAYSTGPAVASLELL